MIQLPLTPFADFVPTPNTPPSEDVLGGVSKHCYQSADDGRSNSDEGSAVGAGCDSGGVSCSGGDRDDGERSATRARKDLNENRSWKFKTEDPFNLSYDNSNGGGRDESRNYRPRDEIHQETQVQKTS